MKIEPQKESLKHSIKTYEFYNLNKVYFSVQEKLNTIKKYLKLLIILKDSFNFMWYRL